MIGINYKGSEVFNSNLLTVPSPTSGKIPSKEWDLLHISGLNKDGVVLPLFYFLIYFVIV